MKALKALYNKGFLEEESILIRWKLAILCILKQLRSSSVRKLSRGYDIVELF